MFVPLHALLIKSALSVSWGTAGHRNYKDMCVELTSTQSLGPNQADMQTEQGYMFLLQTHE